MQDVGVDRQQKRLNNLSDCDVSFESLFIRLIAGIQFPRVLRIFSVNTMAITHPIFRRPWCNCYNCGAFSLSRKRRMRGPWGQLNCVPEEPTDPLSTALLFHIVQFHTFTKPKPARCWSSPVYELFLKYEVHGYLALE